MHTFKLHESYIDNSKFPAETILQFPRKVVHNKYSHEKDESKLLENVNFHLKRGRIKHNINYDGYSSEGEQSGFFGEKEQNMASGNYNSQDAQSTLSSEYDADVEDIHIEGQYFAEEDKKCMKVWCDLFDKNCENSNNNDLSTFMESLLWDGHNKFANEDKSGGKNIYVSEEKLDKLLGSENAKKSPTHKHRHKRASFIIPQLAVVIPMMDNEENKNEDVSKKLKRCLKKSCRTDLCHRIGCYEDSDQEPEPGESYENEYNAPLNPNELSQPYDSTLLNSNTNADGYNSNGLPVHTKLTPWQRAKNKKKDDEILRSKFPKLPSHLKERKHEPTSLLHAHQLSGRLNGDDSSSESSLQIHLHCVERLKKWLNAQRERSRNSKKPMHRYPYKQAFSFNHQPQIAQLSSHKQLEIPTNFEDELQNPINERDPGSLLQPKHARKSNENNSKEYLLLPKESNQKMSPNISQIYNSTNENYWLSAPYSTLSAPSYQSEKQQEHSNQGKTQEDNKSVTADFRSYDNLRNSKLHSSLPLHNTALHHIKPDNLKSQYRASEYLHKEIPKKIIYDSQEIKFHPSARKDLGSSDKRFVPSEDDDDDDDELYLPAKPNTNLPTSNMNKHFQHSELTPIQSVTKEPNRKTPGTWQHAGQILTNTVQKEQYGQNSGILQQVSLQEIYKNLPQDFELSAGQWIHLKPIGKNKTIQSGTSYHQITEKPKKQYNKGTQNLTGHKYRSSKSSENNDQEFAAIPQKSMISALPNKLNIIADNFQKSKVPHTDGNEDDYESVSHTEYTSSEESREPANTEENRQNIKTYVYLPESGNMSTQVINDNSILTTEQSSVEQFTMSDKNHSMAKNISEYISKEILSLRTPHISSHSEITVSLKNGEKKLDSLSLEDQSWTHEQPTESPIKIKSKNNDRRILDKKQPSNWEFLPHMTNEDKFKNELSNTEDIPTTKFSLDDNNNKFDSPESENMQYHEDGIKKTTLNVPLLNNQNFSNGLTKSKTKPHIVEEHSASNEHERLDLSISNNKMNLTKYANTEKNNLADTPPEHDSLQIPPSISQARLNNADYLPQNDTKEKVILAQSNEDKTPYHQLIEFVSDTTIIPGHETSDKTASHNVYSSISKSPERHPGFQPANVYYSTEKTFRNLSDESSHLSQTKNKSYILRSSSSEATADEELLWKYEAKEGHLQPHPTQTVYPYHGSKSFQISQTSASSGTSGAAPTQEGVSDTKISHQSSFEEQISTQTRPEGSSQTYYIRTEEDKGKNIPFTSYQTAQGNLKYTPSVTKADSSTSAESSHTTGRLGMHSEKNTITGTHDKIPLVENIYRQKESKSPDYKTVDHNLYNLQPSINSEIIPTKESMSGYSGALLILDPTTGVVTETIPVIGRVLSARSKEGIYQPHQDGTHSSHHPHTFSYLSTNSPIKLSETFNTAKSDDNLLTLFAQDIPKSTTYFSIEIVDPTSRVYPEQNKQPEFKNSETSDHSTQTETIMNKSQTLKEDQITPSPLRQSLESSLSSGSTKDTLQTRADDQVTLPDLNITCLSHVKDPPCELAQNDVYRNFFTVMLKEMQRLGKENCSQNCTSSKIVPACEQCIKNLINTKINNHSMDEEVKDFAAKHCPQQKVTFNNKNISSAEQTSSAPYTKCKYKFIADLTSLFGLWLKAISNSR